MVKISKIKVICQNQGGSNLNNQKIVKAFKNFIIVFVVFATGFIGSMLLIFKRSNEAMSTVLHAESNVTESVNFFGFKIAEYTCVYQNEEQLINIEKSGMYNSIPILAGIVLLLIVIVLVLLTKRILKKKNIDGSKVSG